MIMTRSFRQALLARHDRSVPRYTSYPTAPHFRHPIDHTSYSGILSRITEDQTISLYIHIPFCRHLCLYCGCHTKIVDHETPILDYLRIVQQEIILATEAIGRRQKVSHIHFGGGTPNFAPIDALEELLETISNRFTLSHRPAIAMEMDPRILNPEKVRNLAQLGVNRASLGVQDFQPDVQHAVNRIQPYEHVGDCVEWLRAAGISSINFDMIYGLPLQTPEKIHDNMEKLKILRPDRVALFGYAHVPWFKEHQKKLDMYALPDSSARFDMAQEARQSLMAAGYAPIGIDHFALPEDSLAKACQERRLQRNFQGYGSEEEKIIVGFGQTAISDYAGVYTQNTAHNREYRDKVLNGALPVVKSCFLSPEDVYRRSVIENVMCYGDVNLRCLDDAERWAKIVWASALPTLSLLEDDDLVMLGDTGLEITPSGHPFTRLVASAFDAYLQRDDDNATMHARAI